MLCLSSRNMIDKTMCEVLWRNISNFYVNLRVEVAAVSRNRYGVEKTVDTHKMFINAIQFYVLSSRNIIDKTMWSFMTKYLWFLCKFTSWSGETLTGNFSDVFFILDKNNERPDCSGGFRGGRAGRAPP